MVKVGQIRQRLQYKVRVIESFGSATVVEGIDNGRREVWATTQVATWPVVG